MAAQGSRKVVVPALLAMKVRVRENPGDTRALADRINEAERAVRAAHPEVRHQFVEPDVEA